MKKFVLAVVASLSIGAAVAPVAGARDLGIDIRTGSSSVRVILESMAHPVDDPLFEDVTLDALRVPNDPSAWGRLARQGDAASGVLVTEEGTFWLASDDAGRLVSVSNEDAAARIPADRRIIDDEKAVDCSSLDWTPIFAGPADLIEPEARTFTVAFAYDELYKERYPGVWQPTLLATIATIDEMLMRDAGIHLEVYSDEQVGIELLPASVVADRTDDTLDRLQDYYVANYGGQLGETVFLFSGKDFTNAGGQVNCVGSAGRTQVSYGVASVAGGDFDWGAGIVMLPDPGIKIGAHELGHTLSAHHHYANCVESATAYSPFHTTDACTVLINDWGLIALQYSTLERSSMIGWADAYGI